MATVLKKRIRLQGFIIAGFWSPHPSVSEGMGQWVKEDIIHYPEDITDGASMRHRRLSAC